jgi:Putative zinc-finger
MNCEKAREILPLYLSGELRGEELGEMQVHLKECEQCTMAEHADRELDNALRTAMLEEEVPDVSAVLARVHERMEAPWWKRMPRLVSVRLAVAAAIMVFALIALPRLYMNQAQRSMALAAAADHYQDLVLLRHPDWEYKPDDVKHFLQRQFPQKQNLLPSITPEGAAFEKVRLCNVRGTSYAHFVFRTGTVETSVFLLPNPAGGAPDQAIHLTDGEHGLDVAGFSSAGLTGLVVGQHGSVPTLEIADRLSKTL